MTALNQISILQMQPRQLQRLGAQRMLYRKAKALFIMKVWLLGALSTSLALAMLLHPSLTLKVVAATVALIALLLDQLFIAPTEKRLKSSAARIQEAFDCEVFDLPWPQRQAGAPETPETEIREDKAYQKVKHSYPTITNWYSIDSALPQWVAVALAQRSNVNWDSSQRGRYLNYIKVILAAAVLAPFIAGLLLNLQALELILLLAALLPIYKLCLDQIRDHGEVITKQAKLVSSADTFLEAASNNPDAADIPNRARHLQDDIYEYRTRSALVLDWLFKLHREAHQSEMEIASAQLSQQALAKFAKKPESPVR